MKKLIYAFLLNLTFFCNSSAIFWGKISDKEIIKDLQKLENAFFQGECLTVFSLYKEIMGKKPENNIKLKVLKYAGECYEKENQIDKAIGIYKLATTIAPEDLSFQKNLGKIYFNNSFYENALEIFEKILKKNNDEHETLLFIARTYSKLGFLENAKRHYIQYVLSNGINQEEILKEYTEFLINKKDIEDALFILDRISDIDKKYDFLILKSRCMAYKANFTQALKLIESAQKIKPLDREGMIRKVMYSILNGDYNIKKELEYFQKDYFANFIMGIINYKNRNYLNAIENFEISYNKGEPFVSSLSKSFIKRIKNEIKILENVSSGK